MAKPRKLEEMLATLAQIRHHPTSDDGLLTLQQVLASKVSVAIAQAAVIVGEFAITDLIPDLVAAFGRCLVNAKTTDPGCLAKKAIAETLYRLDYHDADVFLQGIRHIQLEPVWGGQEDTAAALRGTCALGLVRMNYPHVMDELADLLADPKPEARIAAARAIAYSANPQGASLLRLRVLVGDIPPVLAECFLALLQLAPELSLPLVARFLANTQEADPKSIEVAEVTAFALGESRLVGALPVLQDWWQQVKDPNLRQTALLAIAMLRQDAAFDFLLSLIADGMTQHAKAAIQALSLYRQDDTLWERVCQTVSERDQPELLRALEEANAGRRAAQERH